MGMVEKLIAFAISSGTLILVWFIAWMATALFYRTFIQKRRDSLLSWLPPLLIGTFILTPAIYWLALK